MVEGATHADDVAPAAPVGVWDVLGALVVPGVGNMVRHRRPLLGLTLFVLGVIAPLVWLGTSVLRHRSWVALGLNRRVLAQLVVVLAVVLVVRLIALAEVIRDGRGRRGQTGRVAIATLCAASVLIPCVIGAASAVEARSDIGRAFESHSDAPLFDAGAPIVTEPPSTTTTPPTTSSVASTIESTTTTTVHVTRQPPAEHIPNQAPPRPRRPDSGVDPALLADVSTILLIGGDAGPGRSGLRTDSMILVSIHRPSGRAALISVPRNLEHMLFPPGSALEQRYPYGFDDIANAIYPRVSSNDALSDAYSVDGLRPGAVAISQAIGYSLDVTIDDYVLIDMKGFVDVIDALGGVTVYVPKAVPTPGNPPNAKHPVPEVIEQGEQFMDGTTALAYVRSRKSDTDYHRARRQRDVLGALARQVSLGDAITGYTAVTSSLGDNLRTSLTTDEFTNLLALLGGETAIVESVGLVPPLVKPSNPNYDAMAKIVGAVQMALVTDVPSGY